MRLNYSQIIPDSRHKTLIEDATGTPSNTASRALQSLLGFTPPRSTTPFVVSNWQHQYAGDQSIGATPVPIPNTVVKPYSADGTPSERTRESRPSPAPIRNALECRCTRGRFVY